MEGQGLIARLGGDKFVVVPAAAMDLDTAKQLAESLSRAGERSRDHRW